jgi:adenylate cyclase
MIEERKFVARKQELGRLYSYLNKAIGGNGQVCFVTGEAGSGKTALISELTRRAQDRHKDLIVAYGQSDAQTGLGDPYLPFREILGQLAGDVEGQLARGAITQENATRLMDFIRFSGRAIVEVGPDLIGIFVPAAGLLTRVGAFLVDEAGVLERISEESEKQAIPDGSSLEQSHIFEQYTNVLISLAEQKPLILVLDDLQWADSASIALLFRLGRRIGDSHILLIGSYRPEEVALPRAGERHPLEKVLAEFKGYYGDININLDEIEETERVIFVDAYLKTEPNRLSAEFCRALFRHTGGHALFTIELLRDLQDRGDIVKDSDGYWAEAPELDWRVLPAKVEGVIEERIGRLAGELREVLTVASTEGEDFTAEVVARVQSLDARRLIRSLSGELEKKHRLVIAQGHRRLSSQNLSIYRFQHNLFQMYLYDQLDEAERVYLHGDIGSVLEELYGDQVDEITVQLARHFQEAGNSVKALLYLQRAGELAAMRYANEEAVMYLSQALEMTPEQEVMERFEILISREKVYHSQGDREAQRIDLDKLVNLSQQLDDQHRAEVMLREARFHESIGEYEAAGEPVEKAIALAQKSGDQQSEAAGFQLMGWLQIQTFEHEAARSSINKALQLSRDIGDRHLEAIVLYTFGVLFYNLCEYGEAENTFQRSLDIARQLGDIFMQARTLNSLGVLSKVEGDPAGAEAYYEQSLVLLQKIGHRRGVGWLLQNIGIIYLGQGEYAKTREYFDRALQISREVDDRLTEGRLLENLGYASAEQGDYRAARAYFEQSVNLSKEIGNKHSECNVLKYLGNVYSDLGDFDNAKTLYDRAMVIARETSEPLLESFVLCSLGDYYSSIGDYSEGLSFNEQSLEIKRKIGNRDAEGDSQNSLGLTLDQISQYTQARYTLEESINLHREIGNRTGECLGMTYLALVFHHLDQMEEGMQYSQAAVEVSRSLGNRSYQALALTVLGHSYLSADRLSEAEAAYRGSMAIRRELGQEHLVVEPQAGLARVYLAQDNISRAMSQVENLYQFLTDSPPYGTLEPMRIYLTCYQVLRDAQDQRARQVLELAHQELQERAEKIEDLGLRESYLENVQGNQEIIREYARHYG